MIAVFVWQHKPKCLIMLTDAHIWCQWWHSCNWSWIGHLNLKLLHCTYRIHQSFQDSQFVVLFSDMDHDFWCALSCQPSCLHFRDQSLDLGILQPHQLLQLLDFCLYDLQHNSTNDLAQQRQGSLQLLCMFCTPLKHIPMSHEQGISARKLHHTSFVSRSSRIVCSLSASSAASALSNPPFNVTCACAYMSMLRSYSFSAMHMTFTWCKQNAVTITRSPCLHRQGG